MKPSEQIRVVAKRYAADELISIADEVAQLEEENKRLSTDQKTNAKLCSCRFEEETMGKIPEGSFCPFCNRRRYETVLVKVAELKEENGRLREGIHNILQQLQAPRTDTLPLREALDALLTGGK